MRSPFLVHCEKFPSVKTFYASAATDASDKYEVWASLRFLNWAGATQSNEIAEQAF